jgi:hypothetical protein
MVDRTLDGSDRDPACPRGVRQEAKYDREVQAVPARADEILSSSPVVRHSHTLQWRHPGRATIKALPTLLDHPRPLQGVFHRKDSTDERTLHPK